MISKPKILVFIDWFYPAYKAGGPVKSVFNLAQALQLDYKFYIVCSNEDLDGEKLTVTINEWTHFQEIPIIYLTKELQTKLYYQGIVDMIKPNIIYYNSLYSKMFTLLPYYTFKKESVTQIIAPRGMLGEGALSIKPLKKKMFIKLAKSFLFQNNDTIWHATSELEASEIKNAIGSKTNVRVAQNLSSSIVKRMSTSKEKGSLKMVFISRLALKKNLLFVLELMVALKEEIGIRLDIYGPIEDKNYWDKCNLLIEQDERINYRGILAPHEIAFTLQQYHLYVLPTLHENYGHSIVEALVSGVPVMISKNTPWFNLEQQNVGAELSLGDLIGWKVYAKHVLGLSQSEYMRMVECCFEFATKNIVNQKYIDKAKGLFE